MSAGPDLPVSSSIPASGLAGTAAGPATQDKVKQRGKNGPPPCLFYDSVTQLFCMLRKLPHRPGSVTCEGCMRP